MKQLLILLKGILMGLADVVPGVSGGTVAFVLGIYPAFMAALSSINFRWLRPLLLSFVSSKRAENLALFREHFFGIHWKFLLPLLGGMGVAIVLGSMFIPHLMDVYPVQMRSFFMGLVLASIAVPFATLENRGLRMGILSVAMAVAVFFLLGARSEPPARWTSVQAPAGLSLLDFGRNNPSLRTSSQLYCPNNAHSDRDNAALRLAVSSSDPERGKLLDQICQELSDATSDPMAFGEVMQRHQLRDRHANPFAQTFVPQRVEIHISKPSFLFIFFAGAFAICAMVLPGISGSFILLILGVYTFVFSSIRGGLSFLLAQGGAFDALLYLVVFGLGVLLGVMSFSRVVTMLFERYKDATLAALIGVMIGSLRVLWPFQSGSFQGGTVRYLWPDSSDPIALSLLLCAAGFLLVTGLALLSRRLDERI